MHVLNTNNSSFRFIESNPLEFAPNFGSSSIGVVDSTYENVSNEYECQDICRKVDSLCKAFVYYLQTHSNPYLRKKCKLKLSYLPAKKSENVISGVPCRNT